MPLHENPIHTPVSPGQGEPEGNTWLAMMIPVYPRVGGGTLAFTGAPVRASVYPRVGGAT